MAGEFQALLVGAQSQGENGVFEGVAQLERIGSEAQLAGFDLKVRMSLISPRSVSASWARTILFQLRDTLEDTILALALRATRRAGTRLPSAAQPPRHLGGRSRATPPDRGQPHRNAIKFTERGEVVLHAEVTERTTRASSSILPSLTRHRYSHRQAADDSSRPSPRRPVPPPGTSAALAWDWRFPRSSSR